MNIGDLRRFVAARVQAIIIRTADRSMGCGSSVPSASAQHGVESPLSRTDGKMEMDMAVVACIDILETLLLRSLRPLARADKPIVPHSERIGSGGRGVSLAFLHGIRAFYRKFGALDKVMGDVCKQDGFEASICSLTSFTGLSLVETVHLVLSEGKNSSQEHQFIGTATTFFSYSWSGTTLVDMLASIERKVEELEDLDGRTRFVWIDMFAASQNLLAGHHLPAEEVERIALKRDDANEYLSRKEDTDHIFHDALHAVDE